MRGENSKQIVKSRTIKQTERILFVIDKKQNNDGCAF